MVTQFKGTVFYLFWLFKCAFQEEFVFFISAVKKRRMFINHVGRRTNPSPPLFFFYVTNWFFSSSGFEQTGLLQKSSSLFKLCDIIAALPLSKKMMQLLNHSEGINFGAQLVFWVTWVKWGSLDKPMNMMGFHKRPTAAFLIIFLEYLTVPIWTEQFVQWKMTCIFTQ